MEHDDGGLGGVEAADGARRGVCDVPEGSIVCPCGYVDVGHWVWRTMGQVPRAWNGTSRATGRDLEGREAGRGTSKAGGERLRVAGSAERRRRERKGKRSPVAYVNAVMRRLNTRSDGPVGCVRLAAAPSAASD